MSDTEQFEYQRHLLRAVGGFLAGTATARMRANRIVAACPRTTPFTVSDIVWGSILSALKDTLIQDDVRYLEELRRFLSGNSAVIRRGYVSYDLRSDMNLQEQTCYTKLQALLDFLDHFPFVELDDAISEYDHRCAEIEAILADFAAFDQESNDTVHNLVLREVAIVVLNIDIKLSMLVTKRFAPKPGYVSVHPYHRPPIFPDATNSVAWARKALRAIAGDDWLYLSWQLSEKGVCFSLH